MPEHKYNSLRDILQKIIDIKGLKTQADLAEIIGVGRVPLYRWTIEGLPSQRVDQLAIMAEGQISEHEIRRFVSKRKPVRLRGDNMPSESSALLEKINYLVGDGSISTLAETIGVSGAAVYNWIKQGEVTPAYARVLASLSKGKYRESDFNSAFAGLVRCAGYPDAVPSREEFIARNGNHIGEYLAKAARRINPNPVDISGKRIRLNFGGTIAELIGKEKTYVFKWSREGVIPPAYCPLIASLSGAQLSELNPVFSGMIKDEAA